MNLSNDETNTARLTGLELALLICMLSSFVGGIGCIYFNRPLISLYCFLAHGCLSLTYIMVSQNRLLGAWEQERYRADTEADERRHLLDCRDKLAALQKEHESCERRLKTAETSLQEALDGQEKLQAQLAEAAEAENYDHLLPEPDGTTVLDIIAVTQSVIQEMEPFCESSGVVVQLSSGSEQLPVKADANYLRILFRNIIDNSVKYMQRGGSLTITLSLVGDDLFIVLKDNGAGLAADETAHIFELNYQGSNRVSGNGLGLTQSRAIVEYYGGTIYAKSGRDAGMGIYIQLPAAERTGGSL